MASWPDVFLSYKSEQSAWANRLQDDLQRYGFDVFVDHDTAGGLKAGQVWEDRLATKIQQTKHFLVLWSGLIGMGSYVMKEIDIRRKSGRPVTLLRLDESAIPPYLGQAEQEFRELIGLHNTKDDAGDVDFFEWNLTIRHLVEQLLTEGSARVVEIPVVVVAMTQSQAIEIANGAHVVNGVKNGAFVQLMALLKKTAPFEPQRYGARPEDWEPFEPALDPSDSLTVEQVIRDFDQERRLWYRAHVDDQDALTTRAVFLPYGQALRSQSTSKRARERLQEGPAVVIVDPLSLVHEEVYGEVIANGLHTLKRAFIIGLGPRISSSLKPVQSYFNVEAALFNDLLMNDPHDRSRSMFRPMLSTCVLNVTHGFELSRWVQVASESILTFDGRSRTRMQSAYQGKVVESQFQSLPSMFPSG